MMYLNCEINYSLMELEVIFKYNLLSMFLLLLVSYLANTMVIKYNGIPDVVKFSNCLMFSISLS